MCLPFILSKKSTPTTTMPHSCSSSCSSCSHCCCRASTSSKYVSCMDCAIVPHTCKQGRGLLVKVPYEWRYKSKPEPAAKKCSAPSPNDMLMRTSTSNRGLPIHEQVEAQITLKKRTAPISPPPYVAGYLLAVPY